MVAIDSVCRFFQSRLPIRLFVLLKLNNLILVFDNHLMISLSIRMELFSRWIPPSIILGFAGKTLGHATARMEGMDMSA